MSRKKQRIKTITASVLICSMLFTGETAALAETIADTLVDEVTRSSWSAVASGSDMEDGDIDWELASASDICLASPSEATGSDAAPDEIMLINDYVYDAPDGSFSYDYLTNTLTLKTSAGTEKWRDYFGGPFSSAFAMVEEVVIERGVTEIAEDCFEDCTGLTEITIPGTVKKIGSWAFSGCTNLREVTLSYGITTLGSRVFIRCTSLEYISIPQSITSIPMLAFGTCTSLNVVSLPSTLKTIESSAFSGCKSLDHLDIPNSVTKIGAAMISGCDGITEITVPANVSKLDGAFSGAKNLKKVQVASDNSYFKSVDGILFSKNGRELLCYPQGREDEQYQVPSGVTKIGQSAFYNCKQLKELTLPWSLNGIASTAFSGCSGLTSLKLPSVSYIGGQAFANCDGLTEIEIPGSIQYLNDSQFWGCKNLEKVKVNEGVKGLAAFVYCSSLKSVELPDSLEYLDATAFDSCSQLTSIRIPDSVTQIGYGAFKNCDALLQITLPKAIKSVMGNAFSGCAGLKTVYYAGKEEDWNQLSIASGNEPLLNAVKRWESSGPQNVVQVPFQDHTYALIDDTLPWQEAKAICEEMGGYLVTINSPAEQEFLTELVQSGTKKNVWIGGDETGTGKFCWSTGEAMNYANWELGQPGSKGEERRGMMMYTPLGAGLAGTWRAVPKTGISNSGYALSDFGYICEWGDYSTEKEEREFDPDQEVVKQVSLYTSDGGKSFRREQQLLDDLYASGTLTMEQWWKLKYQFWADYGVTDLRESLAYMRDASAAEQAYDYLTDDELFLAYQYMYYLNCTTKGQVARGLLWSQDFIYNGNTPSQVLDYSNFINQETVSIKGYKTMLMSFMKYQSVDLSMYGRIKTAKTTAENVITLLDAQANIAYKKKMKNAATYEEMMELCKEAFSSLEPAEKGYLVPYRRSDLKEVSEILGTFGDMLQFTATSVDDLATLAELEFQMELARTYDDFLKEIAEAESCDDLPLGLIIAAKELREELTQPLKTVLIDFTGQMGDHVIGKTFDLHTAFVEKLGDTVGGHVPEWLEFNGELLGDALKTIKVGASFTNFITKMGGVVTQSKYVEAHGMLGRYYSRLLAESKARFLSDKTPENAWEFYDRYQSLFAIREAGEKAYLDMCSRSAFTKIIGKWSGANIADKEKFVQNTFDHMNERCRLMLWSEELDLELTGHHVAKKAAIKCPVDVEIYDPSGSLIYTIQDGVESDVTMQQGRFVCRYEPLTGDYTKVLYFFDDGDYQLKMIGTDAGEVSMGLASMTSGTEMTEWQANGIPVLKGGMIQLNIADGTYQADGNADGTFEMAGTLDERKTSAALAGLVLSQYELTLQTGQTAALGVSASPAGTVLPHVWWESSNQAVASVSDGAVTALAKGTAVITVHSEDLTAQCVVNVTGQEHSGETTDPAPGPTPGPTPEPDPVQKPDPIPAHQSKSDDSDDDDTAAAQTGGMQLMNPAYLGEGSWSFDPASGSWSCKKPDGSLLKSCWAFLNGRWYLFDPAGKMLVNWVLVQGTWYCLGQDGAMLTGWVKTGEKWYYLGEDGAMLTGRRLIDGVWYDLDGE